MVDKKKKSKLEGKDTGTRNLVLAMVILVIIVGAVTAVVKNRTNSGATLPSSVSSSNGYGIEFNKSAPVKVDFYEDFQCPHCRDFEVVNNTFVNGLVQAGKIHAIYHPMSFIGPESVTTAAASACAADQGKFLDFHKALFQNQPATENSGYWTNATLIKLGNSVGISSSKFADCINNGSYLNWTKNIENDAAAKNVNSTPTVFINGKAIAQSAYLDPAAFALAFSAAGVK